MNRGSFLYYSFPSHKHDSIPLISLLQTTTPPPAQQRRCVPARPHQRQWLHRAAARQRPCAPAPSPVPIAASRGHHRWSLLPPQENGVGSIPSSVQHGNDLSSLPVRRFVALSHLLPTSASSPLVTSSCRRNACGWSIPCVARRFLNF
jgi:hypothetical protein